MKTARTTSALAGIAALSLVLAACGDDDTDTGTSADPTTEAPADTDAGQTTTAPDDDHDHDDDDHDDDDHDDDQDHDDEGEGHGHAVADRSENSQPTPRITVTYDGGLLVLDAETLEVEGEFELAGFNRINGAGDGRHVLVSTEGGWAPLDTGTWRSPHGDHDHYYTQAPELHEVLVAAQTPAHVVVHDGLTALFDDGTGDVTVLEASSWTEAVEHGVIEAIRTYTTPAPHHGVAIADTDGRLLVSQGDEDGRTGAVLLDGQDNELEASDQCPGLHGETVAGEDLFVVGCEDGVLLLHGDHFHKVSSPDEYGRIGNAFGFDGSPIVLGDYRNDPDGGIALTQFTLIDTEAETIELVDLGAEYTWRGLTRGDDGEVLVLGNDGALRVIDPDTGEADLTIPVLDAWDVPEDWQEAHPAVVVVDWMAYVTDPATNTVHIVDYVGGEVWRSVEIPQTPIEIVGVTG